MKKSMKLFAGAIAILLMVITTGCSREKLPESYGIYAQTEDSLKSLSSQKINYSGNLMSGTYGVKGLNGLVVKGVKSFIVFKNKLNPEKIKLNKMKFEAETTVRNVFGRETKAALNLWVKGDDVAFDIAPVKDKPDMFKLTFKVPLTDGFYALHFGELSGDSPLSSMGEKPEIYDFVIGAPEQYYFTEETMLTDAWCDQDTGDSGGSVNLYLKKHKDTVVGGRIEQMRASNIDTFPAQELEEFEINVDGSFTAKVKWFNDMSDESINEKVTVTGIINGNTVKLTKLSTKAGEEALVIDLKTM